MKGNYVVTSNSEWANEFEVSIDGGARNPVDYSNYTILCYPILSKCNAQFVRDVSFNSVSQTVEYKIEVTQCNKCEEDRITENYVLVPKFPSNYKVKFDVSYVNLE
jgi:NMD protein affecting ribosome stability and mRNA decay